MIGNIHKNNLSNLVALCKECHINTHNGNLEINGFIQTSNGKELDVNIISDEKLLEKKKSRKKFSDKELNVIRGYKGKGNNSLLVKLLSEREKIKISVNTLKKVLNDTY
jgi:autonomous glycyl radical cofactor GrcA